MQIVLKRYIPVLDKSEASEVTLERIEKNEDGSFTAWCSDNFYIELDEEAMQKLRTFVEE